MRELKKKKKREYDFYFFLNTSVKARLWEISFHPKVVLFMSLYVFELILYISGKWDMVRISFTVFAVRQLVCD